MLLKEEFNLSAAGGLSTGTRLVWIENMSLINRNMLHTPKDCYRRLLVCFHAFNSIWVIMRVLCLSKSPVTYCFDREIIWRILRKHSCMFQDEVQWHFVSVQMYPLFCITTLWVLLLSENTQTASLTFGKVKKGQFNRVWVLSRHGPGGGCWI